MRRLGISSHTIIGGAVLIPLGQLRIISDCLEKLLAMGNRIKLSQDEPSTVVVPGVDFGGILHRYAVLSFLVFSLPDEYIIGLVVGKYNRRNNFFWRCPGKTPEISRKYS